MTNPHLNHNGKGKGPKSVDFGGSIVSGNGNGTRNGTRNGNGGGIFGSASPFSSVGLGRLPLSTWLLLLLVTHLYIYTFFLQPLHYSNYTYYADHSDHRDGSHRPHHVHNSLSRFDSISGQGSRALKSSSSSLTEKLDALAELRPHPQSPKSPHSQQSPPSQQSPSSNKNEINQLPTTNEQLKTIQTLESRITRLEHMLHSYLSFGIDPFLFSKSSATCQNRTELEEDCAKYKPLEQCELGMSVCLDHFPRKRKHGSENSEDNRKQQHVKDINHPDTTNKENESSNHPNNKDNKEKSENEPPCIIYDFGIRKEPDFGIILSRPPYHCQVHAFDPSPVTQSWFETSPEARLIRATNSSYHMHYYGGGGEDGTVRLLEYNWNQVTVYHYPEVVLNMSDCKEGECSFKHFEVQKEYPLPVRSVTSIMKELGHDRIDILKLDVEGSEYRILEELILSGTCKKIDQITLEWHHWDVDVRYGEGSVPAINVLITLLREECGLHQYYVYHGEGWPSNEEKNGEMGIVLRYNLAAFMRVDFD